MQDLKDRQQISELMHNWGFWRDQRCWDELRTTFHPEGTIRVTWFSGKFTDFVNASIEMTKRRTGSKHWIGGSLIRLNGDRAVSETNVMIMGRTVIHDVEVDTVAYGRFHDRLERRHGTWRILMREAIYEKDRVDPVEQGAQVPFDKARLARQPAQYRHLAYSLENNGFPVANDLPVNGSPQLEKLSAESAAWLAQKPASE